MSTPTIAREWTMPRGQWRPWASVLWLALAASGCGGNVLPTGNLPPPSAGLQTLAPLPSMDPVRVADELATDGWRELAIPDAGIRLFVPQGWIAITSSDLPGLGDFAGLPASARPMELLQPDLSRLEDGNLIAFVVEQPAPGATNHETVLTLAGWDFWDGEPLDQLVPILANDRAGFGGWYEQGQISTGVGPAGRIHTWRVDDPGPEDYDYLEYVFMSPSGPPYTMSFLMSATRVDMQWPLVDRIAASVRPLD